MKSNLAYFHTHICSPDLPLCVTGSAVHGLFLAETRPAHHRQRVPRSRPMPRPCSASSGDKIVTARCSRWTCNHDIHAIAATETLTQLGKQIAMHVAAAHPQALDGWIRWIRR